MESFGEPTLLMPTSLSLGDTSMEIDKPASLLSGMEDAVSEQDSGFGSAGESNSSVARLPQIKQ